MFSKTSTLLMAAMVASSAILVGVAEARTNGGANGASSAGGPGDNGPELSRPGPVVKIIIQRRRPARPMRTINYVDCDDVVQTSPACAQGR